MRPFVNGLFCRLLGGRKGGRSDCGRRARTPEERGTDGERGTIRPGERRGGGRGMQSSIREILIIGERRREERAKWKAEAELYTLRDGISNNLFECPPMQLLWLVDDFFYGLGPGAFR